MDIIVDTLIGLFGFHGEKIKVDEKKNKMVKVI